jgi:hypothetical protein
MIPRTSIPKTPSSVYPSRLLAILVKRFSRERCLAWVWGTSQMGTDYRQHPSRDSHRVLVVRYLSEAAERPYLKLCSLA